MERIDVDVIETTLPEPMEVALQLTLTNLINRFFVGSQPRVMPPMIINSGVNDYVSSLREGIFYLLLGDTIAPTFVSLNAGQVYIPELLPGLNDHDLVEDNDMTKVRNLPRTDGIIESRPKVRGLQFTNSRHRWFSKAEDSAMGK
jgi:hypothetical protein